MQDRIVIKELAANEVNLLSDLLMVFMTKEPMNTALAIDKERDKEAVCKLFIPQLQSSKTVFVLAAWDTELDKAAGFLHGQTLCDSPMSLEGCGFTDDVVETLNDIIDFLGGMLSYDVAKHLAIRADELVYFNISAVSEEYQGQGLAKRMRRRAIEVSKEKGYKGCMSCATSFYNQTMLAKHFGLETIFERSFEENYRSFSRMPANVRAIHNSGKELKPADWPLVLEPFMTFMAKEPTCSVIPIESEQDRKAVKQLLQILAESPKAVMLLAAWDTQEEKAAGFLGAEEYSDALGPFPWDESGFPEESAQIGHDGDEFMSKVLQVDITKALGTDRIVFFYMSGISEEYQRRGLARRLRECGMELAKKRGYEACLSGATSLYNQNMLAKYFALETLNEVNYAEHFKHSQAMFDRLGKVHKSAKLMGKRL